MVYFYLIVCLVSLNMRLLLCFSYLLVTVYCLPPPSYLKVCSVKEDFEKCALKSAEKFIPSFIPGDKKYGIPVIDPFKFDLLTISPGDRFNLNLTDISLFGLKDSTLTGVKYDPKKKHMSIHVETPKAELKSKYVVNGQILILPISGNGDFSFKINGAKAIFSFDLVPDLKNGQEFAKVTNDHLDLQIENANINLENLFNGDAVLGNEVNKFVNENWREVYKDLEGAIKEPISAVCRLVLQNYFARIPLKELILE